MQLLDSKTLTRVLKRLVFSLFLRLFIEYLVNIFLILLVLNFTRRHGVYGEFFGLQQFGVIPFEIRTLKIGHTEQRRTQRFYIVAIVRHRGTVGAWSNRGYLRVLLIFLSTSFQSSGLQDFLKRLFVYYQSYQQHVHYASVALCAFGTSVILPAFTSVFSPSLCAFYMPVGLLYHSIFRKNLKFNMGFTESFLLKRSPQRHRRCREQRRKQPIKLV